MSLNSYKQTYRKYWHRFSTLSNISIILMTKQMLCGLILRKEKVRKKREGGGIFEFIGSLAESNESKVHIEKTY